MYALATEGWGVLRHGAPMRVQGEGRHMASPFRCLILPIDPAYGQEWPKARHGMAQALRFTSCGRTSS